jgi:hypothetical protein
VHPHAQFPPASAGIPRLESECVAAGLRPAVELGILPSGTTAIKNNILKFTNLVESLSEILDFHTSSIYIGFSGRRDARPSTAGRMAAATEIVFSIPANSFLAF